MIKVTKISFKKRQIAKSNRRSNANALRQTNMTKNIHNISPIIKLELLGIGSIRYLEVKARLEEALAEMGLELSIHEIKDIDHILENDILGIPALKINNRIVFQNTVPTVIQIKSALKAVLQETK